MSEFRKRIEEIREKYEEVYAGMNAPWIRINPAKKLWDLLAVAKKEIFDVINRADEIDGEVFQVLEKWFGKDE